MQNDPIYQTFYKAIFERNSDAWAEIAERYRPLMIAWAHRYRASVPITDFNEDLADQALARAWAALSPEQFETFPSVAALMAYLRMCVRSTIIDCARVQRNQDRLRQIEGGMACHPGEEAVSRIACGELWKLLDALVDAPQERIVLREAVINGVPPRQILTQHPAVFADINAVYAAKRNLLERLRRNPDLRNRYDAA